MPDPEDRYIEAGGVQTRYWSVGQGKCPLILLHGLGGTVEDWGETITRLAEHRRVIAIDLLGNGRTDKPAGCAYSPDEMRDHVSATLEALALDVVDLNGWSLGGRIALDLAHVAPHRVRKLVLTAPAGIGPDSLINFDTSAARIMLQLATRPGASGLRILRNALRSGGGRRLARFTARRLNFVIDTASRIAFLHQLRSFVGPSGYLEGPRQQLLRKLPDIDTPTVAIWGRQDNFAPFSHAGLLQRKMPNCRISAMEQCGHTPHIEWPDIYVDRVDAFLRST